MSGAFNLPLMLEGSAVDALVVGGGPVATRKTLTLAEGGATVRVRAPQISDALARRSAVDERILIERGIYDAQAIGDALLVVAATSDRTLNGRIAEDARRARRLVLVADDPRAGNCVMPAVHRAGELVVAVSSGGVPRASTRIRDAIARRFDARYADAVRDLVRLRKRLLSSERPEAWHAAAGALLAQDFCESVENGEFTARLGKWR